MLGVATVALGGLTVTVGSLVDAQTASADATRIAGQMDEAIQPASTTGPDSGRLQFADGSLTTVERDLRVLRNGSVVAEHAVDALVFEAGDRRVASLGGAIVRGRSGNAWLTADPLVTDSERNAVLVVGVPRLGADGVAVAGAGSVAVTLRTNVTHDRRTLGPGRYAVAVETATPEPFERYFRDNNATVERRDFDGDGTESVVADYPKTRRGYLVVHDLALEVDSG
jgi:hypothetical protein